MPNSSQSTPSEAPSFSASSLPAAAEPAPAPPRLPVVTSVSRKSMLPP